MSGNHALATKLQYTASEFMRNVSARGAKATYGSGNYAALLVRS
jgi:hypothetical protein